jgi:murein L,D-transpeptidase YafK
MSRAMRRARTALCDPAGRRLALAAGLVLLVVGAAPLLWGPSAAAVIGRVDQVMVDKSERRLYLLRDGRVLESFAVALGRNPSGPKLAEGDGRTPEGRYRLTWRDPDSSHYKAILISYPNAADKARAAAAGVDPGGEIMLHGQRSIWRWFSRDGWTDGCIAVSNAAMDVIWNATRAGTPIVIRP